jgi:3-methyladenine DNA glycosylase/8-oxoguanine DNA glycosylase
VLGFVPWFAAVVALYALGTLDVVSLSPLGIPEI